MKSLIKFLFPQSYADIVEEGKLTGVSAESKRRDDLAKKDSECRRNYERPLGVPMISIDGNGIVRVVVNTDYVHGVTLSVDLISGKEMIDFTMQLRYSDEMIKTIMQNDIKDVYTLITRGNGKILKDSGEIQSTICSLMLAVKKFKEKGLQTK
ncbi:hypothetical protein phiAS5_ORF0283 [Aeromonas phage phiAS5]|uniref:Uncharacterized protein n=1 Tax=Aeromonas phage phiAS5 TaxID=879630 RepID=E1A237_9CAUD|nr:hypothetical protein phiAS5_ORF0283 [Aeromonas phage phiAS5]ADM80126.1 hypothetical protein phiAS5_ORF0283 [Aeromonas phage phiAS5]BES53111.1 hypothetical protein [Aeromonas phage phiWae14]